MHDSVAATLRMFREDENKESKIAVDKREIHAREQVAYRAKNQEVLAGILKRAKNFK